MGISLVRHRDEKGLVLLTVLVFILVTTMAASSLVVVYKTQMQREKEQQLLFTGAQFRRAIASYYNTIPPGGTRSLPQSIEELLNDNRFPKPIQHLRRIYPDPITGRPDWHLISENGGIVGVASSSLEKPIKTAGFTKENANLEGKTRYADWLFSISQPR